VWILVSAWFEW